MSGASLGPWGEARAARQNAPRASGVDLTGAPLPDAAAPRGQTLGWAVVSTILLAGYLWWAMGSWIYPVAGVIGILVIGSFY